MYTVSSNKKPIKIATNMNLINLDTHGKVNYSPEDVIACIARKLKVSEKEAERLIQSGDGIPALNFVTHPIIIGKSFGDIVALHINPVSQLPALHSRYFKSGWPIAVATPGLSDAKVRKDLYGKKRVHPLYKEIMDKLKSGTPIV